MIFGVSFEQNMDDRMEITEGLTIRPIIESEYKLLYKWAKGIGLKKKDLSLIINDNQYQVQLIDYNNNTIGFLISKIDAVTFNIELLFIEEEYRSKGYGSSVIEHIKLLYKTYKLYNMTISLPVDNPKIDIERVFKFLIDTKITSIRK